MTTYIKRLALLLVLGLVLLGAAYSRNIERLYVAITLYEPDKIAHNFLTMYQAFNAKRIEPAAQPFVFASNPHALPASFEFNGQSILLDDFLSQSQSQGLMVIKHGQIWHEQYFNQQEADTQHISFSVAKSFISALFGIALAEGYISSIEQRVTDYVPELQGSGYDSVRIKDVLQMSSGVKFNEDYGDFFSDINRFSRAIAFGTSLDDFSASLIRQRQPGTYHHYVSIDTQVLGMILTRATGQSLSDYLNDKILQPIGIQDPVYWLADDNGMELALGGLNLTLRDYAKFAWLFVNQGRWTDMQGNSQQVVPHQWVIDSVTPDAPHLQPGENNPASSSRDGYGYQWWIPLGAEDEFMAKGIYGQYIYIDPDQNLAIVKLSAIANYNDASQRWGPKHLAMFRAISEHLATLPR